MPSTLQTSRSTTDANQALQCEIDHLAAAGGGEVLVPAGRHVLYDSLHLRSGVSLRGEPGAILEPIPWVSSPVSTSLGYGLRELRVEHPERFHVGMGVHIKDDRARAFMETVATIVDVHGQTLLLDRPLEHDCSPIRHGHVTSAFPVVAGRGAHNVAVRNLTLQGPADHQAADGERPPLDGCRNGGLYLIACRDVRIDQVEVTGYPGDAISFQQCIDLTARQCELHHNRGCGLHPGSGSVRYAMIDCDVHDNARHGLFYCLRTTHSLCRGNTLTRNGEDGITVGERDTDHLIEQNTIRENRGAGLSFRAPRAEGAARVVARDNAISENEGGDVDIPSNLHDIHVLDHASDSANLPPVGPDAAEPNAAAHLGVPQLMPWRSDGR